MNDYSIFKTAHRRLTFLCASITAAILCLFSFLYLYLAEKTIQNNQHNAFLQDMMNFTSSLKQQSVITQAYLNGIEQSNGYQIYLWDQEISFLFNSIQSHTLSQEELDLLWFYLPSGSNAAGDVSREATDTLTSAGRCTLLSEGENWSILKFRADDAQEYRIYLTRLTIGQLSASQLSEVQSPGITLFVAASYQEMKEQLFRQRMYFLLLDIAGVLLLTWFAGFFTKRMLLPLRESHERQIRFIADASHELRTPLAVIRACLSARPPAYEQTIDRECAHMGRLIEDMLTLSRLDQGMHMMEWKDVDLDTLLLTVYEQMEILAARKGIHLNLKLPEESLPHISGDFSKLEQLITILLQNALSYTPEGGRVMLEARFSSTVQIYVTDNGPGISDIDKAHIFERFYRAERSHTDRTHFGLGLCIAQEIAHAHGGNITVTDTEGGGATFIFTLTKL